MKIAACLAAALMVSITPLSAEEQNVSELLKPAPPVPEAENGGDLMAKLEKVSSRREMRAYDFGFKPPEYVVNRNSLDAFMEEQSELVKITREIMARKEFRINSEKLPDGIQCLIKACTAVRLQSLLSAKEGKWDVATPDLLHLSSFHRRMMWSAESTSLVMMAVGLASQDAGVIPELIRQTPDLKPIRSLAEGCEAIVIPNRAFGGVVRTELRKLLEHFETIRSGGEPLKRRLAELVQANEMGTEWGKAMEKVKKGDPDPAKGIMDVTASRQKRISELMEKPSATMEAQLKEIEKIDWREHDRNFIRYVKALPGTDFSTWARYKETVPQPQSFFSGFVLEQVQPESAVRQFWSERLYKAAATSRLGKVSLALCVWQLDHENSLPDRLDQLVPQYLSAVPADPYDGKPVRYHKDRQCLWCVGPDLKDDIGTLKSLEARSKDDDVTIAAGKKY